VLIVLAGPFAASILAKGNGTTTNPAAAKADVAERLKALGNGQAAEPQATTTAPTATIAPKAGHSESTAPGAGQPAVQNKGLQEILQERLRWIDEFEKVTKILAEIPQASALENRIAAASAELRQLNRTLATAAKTPESLLPESFPKSGSKVSEAMKQALESQQLELKAWATKLEALKTEAANWETQQAALQTERDKLFHTLATTRARILDRDSVASLNSTPSARRLAQERGVNLEWEEKAETLRLEALEAQINLGPKLAAVREHEIEVCRAHVEIETRTIALMQARYTRVAELQEQELEQKADSEKSVARRSNDPLVRFRARREAQLLELEAQVIKNEQYLTTKPAPCLDEQKALADHAVTDFETIKQLLEDGSVSRLDAIRLNNDFRRIGPERDRLVRNELATVEARLQFYENLLTSVELELLQDSLHDTLENDLQNERLAPDVQVKAEQLISEYESKHRTLLLRRKDVLERLSIDAAQTLDQVTRRLDTLNEEYGFIRTHIFWVRDQEPIGLGTVTLLGRELPHLAAGLLRLAREWTKPPLWGSPSAEFIGLSLLMLVLPFAVVRLRSALRRFIECDLPGECVTTQAVAGEARAESVV
jgi:potassium efflux system protein